MANKKKYFFNEKFLDQIDIEEKAYFLGLLYADGYNNSKSGYVELQLHGDDVEILNRLIKIIDSNRPLQIIKRNSSIYYRMIMYSHYFSKICSKVGCVNRKTFELKFPLLKEELIKHFIRGYFDGDGSVWIDKKNAFHIDIVGTIEFLTGLHNHLKSILMINDTKMSERYPERKTNIRTLRYGGNILIDKIYKYLYTDSDLFLKRKDDIFKKLKVGHTYYKYDLSGVTYDNTTSKHLFKILSEKTGLSSSQIGIKLRMNYTVDEIIKRGKNNKNNLQVQKLNEFNEILDEYFSLSEAGRKNNLSPDMISLKIKQRKKYKGHYWRFV